MNFGVVLQTDPPARAVVELAQLSEVARLRLRVDLRLARALAGAVRHLLADPGLHHVGHGRADGDQPACRATGPLPPRCSPRSTTCTATAPSAASVGATPPYACSEASRPAWAPSSQAMGTIKELAEGRPAQLGEASVTIPWVRRQPPRGADGGLRPPCPGAGRPGGRRRHPPDRRPVHHRVGHRRWPVPRPRPLGATPPRSRCASLLRPTWATTWPHQRDQLRWFGGMVGNHVADIVERYGADAGACPTP